MIGRSQVRRARRPRRRITHVTTLAVLGALPLFLASVTMMSVIEAPAGVTAKPPCLGIRCGQESIPWIEITPKTLRFEGHDVAPTAACGSQPQENDVASRALRAELVAWRADAQRNAYMSKTLIAISSDGDGSAGCFKAAWRTALDSGFAEVGIVKVP